MPQEGRILYATATLVNGVMSLDTTKSREILAQFAVKKVVPQARFYTSIDLLDGKTPGEELGHYRKGTALYAKTEDTAPVSGKNYYTLSGSTYSKVSSPSADGMANYYEQLQAEAGNINFMIVHKPAIIKFDKHTASNIIPASSNADADADISKYRKYGIVDGYKNKRAGIYMQDGKGRNGSKSERYRPGGGECLRCDVATAGGCFSALYHRSQGR